MLETINIKRSTENILYMDTNEVIHLRPISLYIFPSVVLVSGLIPHVNNNNTTNNDNNNNNNTRKK